MKRSAYTIALAWFVISGCGQDQATTVGNADQAESQPVVWDSSLIDGGEMFNDYPDFRNYVRRSTFIAKGTLTHWDRDSRHGSVAVEDVLLGDPDMREAALVYDGGVVSAQPGDKVLILLRVEEGSLKLNSFCGVSGVTLWTDGLETLVSSALQPL